MQAKWWHFFDIVSGSFFTLLFVADVKRDSIYWLNYGLHSRGIVILFIAWPRVLSSSCVTSYSSGDLFRHCLIASSKNFQIVFVHLVYNSALFLASCCCSFLLHDVDNLICIFFEIYIFFKPPSLTLETHPTSYFIHSGSFSLCGKAIATCSLRLVSFEAKFKKDWSYTPLHCTPLWHAQRQLQFHFTLLVFKTVVTLFKVFIFFKISIVLGARSHSCKNLLIFSSCPVVLPPVYPSVCPSFRPAVPLSTCISAASTGHISVQSVEKNPYLVKIWQNVGYFTWRSDYVLCCRLH